MRAELEERPPSAPAWVRELEVEIKKQVSAVAQGLHIACFISLLCSPFFLGAPFQVSKSEGSMTLDSATAYVSIGTIGRQRPSSDRMGSSTQVRVQVCCGRQLGCELPCAPCLRFCWMARVDTDSCWCEQIRGPCVEQLLNGQLVQPEVQTYVESVMVHVRN